MRHEQHVDVIALANRVGVRWCFGPVDEVQIEDAERKTLRARRDPSSLGQRLGRVVLVLAAGPPVPLAL